MAEKKPRTIIPFSGSVFHDLLNRIKLIVRLMGDRRVSAWLKLIPVGSLVYLVFPDILPGPIDDAAIIWLSTVLFVELCPPEVVKEHLDAIAGVITARVEEVGSAEIEPVEGKTASGEVIEGEFRDEEWSA